LRHEGRTQHPDGPLARERRQPRRILAQRHHHPALEENGRADGHDDEVQHIGMPHGPYDQPLHEHPDGRDRHDGEDNDHDERQVGRREDGGTEHAAEHGELALREIDRPRGIEDDVEPERDETVDRPHHEPREEELQQVGRAHATPPSIQIICRRPA
jgi:hypothetical protein